jgi:hypothetical protein
MNNEGLIKCPSFLTDKCKWSPVDFPVDPEIPIGVLGITLSNGWTRISDK